MSATDRNYIEMVRLLLDRGADTNAEAMVTLALHYEQPNLMLVPSSQNGHTALLMAADRNNTEMVRLLLDRGANIKSAAKVITLL